MLILGFIAQIWPEKIFLDNTSTNTFSIVVIMHYINSMQSLHLIVWSFLLMVSCNTCKLWSFVAASASISFTRSSLLFSCTLISSCWSSSHWTFSWASLSCWRSEWHSSKADRACCLLSSLLSLPFSDDSLDDGTSRAHFSCSTYRFSN